MEQEEKDQETRSLPGLVEEEKEEQHDPTWPIGLRASGFPRLSQQEEKEEQGEKEEEEEEEEEQQQQEEEE